MPVNKNGKPAYRWVRTIIVLTLVATTTFVGYFVLTGKLLYYSIFNHSSRQVLLEFRQLVSQKGDGIIVMNARIKDGEDNYLVYVDLLPERVTDEPIIIDLRCLKIIANSHTLYNPYIVGKLKIGNYTALEISNDTTNPTSVVWQFTKGEDSFEQFAANLSKKMDVTYTDFPSGNDCL